MKTIKFRAWGKQINYDVPRRENGCADWVVFMCYTPNIYNGYNSDEAADINDGIKSEQKDGVIFMQYTGLKDKNEKDIYEGDICKAVWDDIYKIGHTKIFEVKYNNGYHNPYSGNCHAHNKTLEVIGNIYENPELLNVG